MRHSERLCYKIDLVLPRLIEASSAIVGHPRFRELYPEMLIRLHWIIRGTVPVMLVARDKCRELAERDPVAAKLALYYDEHARVEHDHDEWLLQDLELLGYSRGDVLSRIPSAVAAESVGARYYWTLHHHPLAELGAMAVAECNPMASSAIDMMQEITGYPRAAFRTLARPRRPRPASPGRDPGNAGLAATGRSAPRITRPGSVANGRFDHAAVPGVAGGVRGITADARA